MAARIDDHPSISGPRTSNIAMVAERCFKTLKKGDIPRGSTGVSRPNVKFSEITAEIVGIVL